LNSGIKLADARSEGKRMMIDGFIIEKLKREEEERERQKWEPIPLPLEEYDPHDREEREKKPEKPREFVIELRLAAAINGYSEIFR
jgi:hypothetical protein